MKVLVADDDEAIRKLVTRLFERRGDTVENVPDGEAAIVKLDGESFDLLLLDLMMPRLDGLGVLAHLASRPAGTPRIIVMTAAIPSLAAAVPRDQVVAVVTKPFELTTLLRIAEESMKSVPGALSPAPSAGLV